MNRRPFFFSALTLIIGILTGIALRQLPVILVFLILLLLPGCLLWKKHRLLLLFLIFFFAAGSFSAAFSYREYTESSSDCALSGTVISIGQKESCTIVLLEDVTLFTPEANALSCRVNVQLPVAPDIAYGNTILVYGTLFPYTLHTENPGETDRTLANLADNIGYSCSASSFQFLAQETSPAHRLYELKNAIRAKIDTGVPDEDCASILYAMVTGDKSSLSTYTYSLFSSCGTSHLLAVSGLHVGILLTLLGTAVRFLRLPSGIKLILTAAFLAFYCLFTGFAPSIVRASLMALLTLGAGILGMRYDMLNALGFAGTVILLLNPFRLFDLSFQLSFAACFGIAVCGGYVQNIRHFRRLLSSLSVSLGATIATLPIALYNFSFIPAASLLANLILVPVASLALILLVAVLPLSFVWNGFSVLFYAPYFLMAAVLKISEPLAELPKLTSLALPAVIIPLFLLLVLVCSRFTRIKPRLKSAIAAVLTVSVLAIGAQSYIPRYHGAELRVLSLKEGQCVHIRCGGENFIIGLNKDSLHTQMQYIGKNIGRVKGVFLLSVQDAEALLFALAAGLDAETVYLAPQLSTPDENILFSSVKLTPEQNIRCGDAVFSLQGEGLQLFCNGFSVYIHPPESEQIPDTRFDIAVTENPKISADAVICRKTEHPACQALYRTCYYGMVSCIIQKDIQFKIYHEVLP